MKQRVIVSCLVKKDDAYLFIKQGKQDGAFKGTYHIPGGGIDVGEDLEAAVRREVLEETGVEIDNLKTASFDSAIVDNYKNDTYQLIFLQFTADYVRGEPIAGDDAAEVVWLNREEITNSQQNVATMRFMNKLGLI
ncbi:MAG: NUDIX domain-containing protein [Lactobacillus sp.]|nr:NUDIX domain-containing protein [Lactobacillus sp.]